LPADTQVQSGDVTALPDSLDPGSYDLVTALAVLEHLEEPGKCVAEGYRMLRPGGVFVATCPNPAWDEVAGKLKMVADEHHEQHMTGPMMRDLLTDAGFQGVVYRPFMWAPVGFLPYLKLDVPRGLAARVDALVRRVPFSEHTFVNQLVFGRK
jgi:SAM-dependent methyltransferase